MTRGAAAAAGAVGARAAAGAPPERRWRRAALGWILPAAVLLAWELAGGSEGTVFHGIVPTPSKVFEAWKVWAFGETGLGLNPYSGTWWSNVVFSTQRVAQGFGLAILLGWLLWPAVA